ncbi:MAG TPA: VOC family protein [archaeon]|nr:VOC family protein [archaeon]
MDKMKSYKVHPSVRIGHIHLTVSDLENSLKFYRDILGFEIMQRFDSAAFLSAGGYHHHIGLNTWNSPGAKKPQEGQIGLYHFAILYPNRKELAIALKRLIEANYPLEGASDHGVSEAIYLKDPDGNGIELYADRPKSKWPKEKKGEIKMATMPLDIEDLLKEAK